MTIRGGTVNVQQGHRVDQGELPRELARQLHRLARHCAPPGAASSPGARSASSSAARATTSPPVASRTLKVKLAKGSKRLAGRKGRLKVLAVATTGRAGKIAQSSQHLTLVLRTATKTK